MKHFELKIGDNPTKTVLSESKKDALIEKGIVLSEVSEIIISAIIPADTEPKKLLITD